MLYRYALPGHKNYGRKKSAKTYGSGFRLRWCVQHRATSLKQKAKGVKGVVDNFDLLEKDVLSFERISRIRPKHAGRYSRPSETDKCGNISTLTEEGKTRDIAAAKAGLGSGKTYSIA